MNTIKLFCSKLACLTLLGQVGYLDYLHQSGNPYLRGRLSTVDLLVLTNLVQLLWVQQTLFTFFCKTSYLNEEVNRTEPSPSVSVICISAWTIDIESLQNRLLKVCYVPATSAGLLRVSFFFSFLFLLLRPLTLLMKQTRQAVRAIKQSIFLDVYGMDKFQLGRGFESVSGCVHAMHMIGSELVKFTRSSNSYYF